MVDTIDYPFVIQRLNENYANWQLTSPCAGMLSWSKLVYVLLDFLNSLR